MSRTVWSIAILGFLTVILLTFAMLFMFKSFGESPYSGATKLSLAIKGEFQFASVGTGIQDEAGGRVLVVQYETRANTKFDLDAQTKEMGRVAEFAADKSERGERWKYKEIRVLRVEVHGRGCFQQSYRSDQSFPNKYRPAAPPDPFKNP